ncbi:MAG: family 78 glycoside hydrolase catalytic domain [Micrococcales bacterium]
MAKWIRVVEQSVPEVGHRPAYLLRKQFNLASAPQSVTLEISAHGVYTAFINGMRVGNDELTPGYTEYPSRTQKQMYNVTEYLKAGENVIAIELADGWFRGAVGIQQVGNQYGDYVEAWVRLSDDANGQLVITSDSSWKVGPTHIVAADLMKGQHEDLRLKNQDAYLAGFDDSRWNSPTEHNYDGQLFAQVSEPNRVTECVRPVKITKAADGVFEVDFGQNLNGWIRLGKLGPAGNKVTITQGEWYDHQGRTTLSNLDMEIPGLPIVKSYQIDSVISDGNDSSIFEPRYTSKGFQFARVEGYVGELTADDIEACLVSADLRRIGRFNSSDARLNWLHKASVWSFRGNSLDVPTDCPTRERSGWTGDWQLYVDTAAFLYDVREFNRKFMDDVYISMEPNGLVPNIAPRDLAMAAMADGKVPNGSSGWGDVVVQAPLVMYQQYGVTDQLEEGFEAGARWVDYAANMAATHRHEIRSGNPAQPHEKYLWDSGTHWGEWLEPDVNLTDFMKFMTEDKSIVSTAFLYRSARDISRIAAILCKPEAVIEKYQTIAEGAAIAWQTEFLNEDGSITVPTQANYVRALDFGLIPDSLEQMSADILAKLVRENGYRLGTGFLATPALLPVLANYGHSDVAFKVLFQEQEPSWLAMRNRGATTIWEQWHGVDADGVPHDSLNHYSKGAVISFLHQYLAGLKPLSPGYKTFSVKPMPAEGLEHVELSLESPHGLIEVEWRQRNNVFSLEVTVPHGSEAHVTLPNGTKKTVGEGEHVFES